jgi:beta-phosphoglucomutase-like phosphatase (HAD superfamily)
MHIIFDFDGVILNSHKIKTKAFYKIFESYGKNIANKAVKFHKQNIGKSRYFKFKFILQNIIKKKNIKERIISLK